MTCADVTRWTAEGWFTSEKRDGAPTAAVTLQVKDTVLAEGNEVVRWHRIKDYQARAHASTPSSSASLC